MPWFSGTSSVGHGSHGSSYSRPHSSSSSYYKRRPRDGYISRMVHRLRKILRDLYYYARRHPVKVFMLVIMPLITGGALPSLLRQFGVRLPAGLAGFSGSAYGGSAYGGKGGGDFGDFGSGGGLQSVMNIAKMFM